MRPRFFALGLALVVVVASVVYVNVTPRSTTDVYVVNFNVISKPTNLTLPALPKAIVFYNITAYDVCVEIYAPGGLFVNTNSGDVYAEWLDVGCYQARWYDYYKSQGHISDTFYFNGTIATNYYDMGFRVVQVPKYVVIVIR